MKKIIAAALVLTLLSCKKTKKYEFDTHPAFLSDTVTLVKNDTYYQKALSVTRGYSVLVDIKNTNDTVKTFVVFIKEINK